MTTTLHVSLINSVHLLKNVDFRLLSRKLHIETLDDLADRLQKILERDISLKTVSSTTFEDKALDDVLHKVKEVPSQNICIYI